MHVLYVDDDPSMTAAVERMFTSEGFQCDSSALGEAAVDLAKRNGYDIILLDVMLPDIDGYEVIKRLRTAGVRTPVLLQSGLVDRESDIDGLWLGASEYLLKPFSKGELFERVQEVLSRPADSSPRDPVHVSPSSAPLEKDKERRRRHRRFETVQPGRILYNGGIDCLILNMSHGGAALQLFDPDADCPESFDLLLQSGATLRCHARWRSADKIGVQGEALFPDKVVTEILKHGEAVGPEETAPQAAPLEVAGEVPASSPMLDQGSVQAPQQSMPTVEPPTESAVEPDPKPEGRPGGVAPAVPPPAKTMQPRQDEPDPAAQPEIPGQHAMPTAEPATDGRSGRTPFQHPQGGTAPVAKSPASGDAEPQPPNQAENGQGKGDKVFTVDQGMRLVAETCECEQLVVDGYIETAARTHGLQVGRAGHFVGTAAVETAEIRGRYEGDLTVDGRLVIRDGGTVSGTIQYREVVIEAGGGLVGQLQLLPRGSRSDARTEAEAQAVSSARQAAAHA